jgi:hypothetical protein
MTTLKRTKIAAIAAAGVMLALGALAGPASARWDGNGQWQEDNRNWNNHYNGYEYRAPPVVYATPYNYGYRAPPVYYNNAPAQGLSIRVF